MDSGRTRIPIMLHLSSERLAELADGEPTVAEAEHLAACAICATERSAHQRLLTMAGDERDRIAEPLTEWSMLSAKLRELGVISDHVPTAVAVDARVVPLPTPRPHRRLWLAGLRVAAGLVFAAGFGALGRMSAGATPAPSGKDLVALGDLIFRNSAAAVIPQNPFDQNSPFSSVEDALATLENSQRSYDKAVMFIAAHDSTGQSPEAGDVFRTRLAALDEMAETSRQALAAAPTDVVLNQYYLSTLGAREVTLRQLGSVLTPGKRLSRF
jgi:hypothetical protein